MLLIKNISACRKLVFFLSLSAEVQLSHSQNLVPNPSFEEYFSCPSGENQLHVCKYWFNSLDGSPDYYNKCAWKGIRSPLYASTSLNDMGFQHPRTGTGYAGIINFNNKYFTYRELITTRLLKPLESGKLYQVSMYVSLADSSQYYNPRFGFCFSTDKKLPSESRTNEYNVYLCSNSIFVYNESIKKDTASWHLIQTEYAAKGGEEYLIIGLCKNNITKKEYRKVKRRCRTHIGNRPYAYYYIDDVSVEEKK